DAVIERPCAAVLHSVCLSNRAVAVRLASKERDLEALARAEVAPRCVWRKLAHGLPRDELCFEVLEEGLRKPLEPGGVELDHLSDLGVPAGQTRRPTTLMTTPIIASVSCGMHAAAELRLPTLRRLLYRVSTADVSALYAPRRLVSGAQWITFRKDGVNVAPLP